MTENLQEQAGTPEAELVAEVQPAEPESKVPSHLEDCAELFRTSRHLEGTTKVDTKCFYMNDGRVFFGIIFFDTSDSFLVGAAARMVFNEGEIKPDPIFPVSVVRLFKNSIQGITKPMDLVKYHYYKYLQDSGHKLLPDFLTGAKMEGISDFIKQYTEGNREKEGTIMSNLEAREARAREGELGVPNTLQAVTPSVYEVMKEMLENKEIKGASEFAFMPLYISEKIQ